ncbi:MAG TPA: Tol-Pal system beta propeller repeat protein TolB [Sphingomicrobium sp.]|nr:Tol-Pal system beta propeller repeat protein TolB [Sphingomicrobium sp.]
MLRKFAFIAVFVAGAAFAQQSEAPPIEVDVVGGVNAAMAIAVPPLATPRNVTTSAGDTGPLGSQMAAVIAGNLRSSGVFVPVGPQGLRGYPYHEAAAPAYQQWRGTGASALVTGFVEARPDGRLTVGCYLYDVTAGRELARQGYVVAPNEWRRAAHRCSDAIYARLSGQSGYFDTRVVYVAETGPKTNRVKRIAIMDSDGTNHRYLTEGRATVLTPRFSPDGRRLVYMSYAGRRPRVWLLDIASGQERPLVPGPAMTFAPRFSPDGRQIVFSMAVNGNSDIYVVDADGYGQPRQLTTAPGADTSPSFSPDGRRIVFESDRSGTQQLYVMNSDGSGQRRITFTSGARYASPVWSPRGDLIAFTRIGGGSFRVGVMTPSGSGERLLTNSWQDEGPSWAPNGEFVMFHRTEHGSGRSALYAVSIQGGAERRLATPQDGSDPSWSPLQN